MLHGVDCTLEIYLRYTDIWRSDFSELNFNIILHLTLRFY